MQRCSRVWSGTAKKCCESGKVTAKVRRLSGLTWETGGNSRLRRDQLHAGNGGDDESKLVEDGHDGESERRKDGGE